MHSFAKDRHHPDAHLAKEVRQEEGQGKREIGPRQTENRRTLSIADRLEVAREHDHLAEVEIAADRPGKNARHLSNHDSIADEDRPETRGQQLSDQLNQCAIDERPDHRDQQTAANTIGEACTEVVTRYCLESDVKAKQRQIGKVMIRVMIP